ncbi:VQ motif-containing protein 17-like [Ananas comosus]|uniref:VQ motif-containing protein 17-like n=1 Tax=Ananas comosus TaxID=4615 RepID=A0A6P5EPN7_ANACO|nr:VQ motif-containing protein 17-like [Ananas comosus]
MEDTTNPQSSTAVQPRARILPIRKNSHVASAKLKPKIRIVHIVAPEIIKTDPENFRELVQKLTGQPTKGIPMQKKINKYRKKNSLPASAIHADAVNGLIYGMNEEAEDGGLFRDFGGINYWDFTRV